MRYGRIVAVLLAVVVFAAACSKGTTSSAPGSASSSGFETSLSGGNGAQGTAAEEAAEGTTEAGAEGDQEAGASGRTVVTAGAGGQLAFSPSTVSVKAGQVIDVKNVSSLPHTFTVTGQNIDVSLQPGQSQRVKVDLAPGTYDFVCTIHQSSGMTGTLTVT